MGVALSVLAAALEASAPLSLAEPWDRPGLQVGDPGASITAVLVALDPSDRAVAAAAQRGAELLLTHHPLLLEPMSRIDLSGPPGRLLARLLRDRVNLYACHTNLDRADGGVNDVLARKLGLTEVRPLVVGEPQVKVVVTVPVGYEPRVRRALIAGGAGRIGNYAGCTFGCRGEGTFQPLDGATPFLGDIGREEQVAETKIEVLVPRSRLEAVRREVHAAHPYEEAALDIYPLENAFLGSGLGRIGRLERPRPLVQWAVEVARRLGTSGVRFVGDRGSPVERVAVCGGSGAALWPDARRAGAQVLVTGDVKYHVALDAIADDMCLVDAGHGATEGAAVEALVAILNDWCRESRVDLRIEAFIQPEPFRFVLPQSL